MVGDLLAYSRVITDEDQEIKPVADLSECWREALEVMQPRIAEIGAEVSAGPLPRVSGNRLHLTHVFHNLLSNSLKYHRPKVTPQVVVRLQQQGDQWTISIRDNGIGFEARHAERIFSLFKRLHGRNVYPGTGLGLAICRRVIERYGGRIWAEGKPGEGAVFHMTLAAAGTAVTPHGSDASAAPDSQKRLAIPENES